MIGRVWLQVGQLEGVADRVVPVADARNRRRFAVGVCRAEGEAVEALREGAQGAVVSPDRAFTTAPLPRPPVENPPGGEPPLSEPPVLDLAPQISEANVALARVERHRDRRRASLSFVVSEPAEVTAALTRAAAGIRDGGRCVAVPKHRPRGAKSCTRQLPAAKGTIALHAAGRGALQLSATGLGEGRYTATLTAVDAAGNASTPIVVRFTVR